MKTTLAVTRRLVSRAKTGDLSDKAKIFRIRDVATVESLLVERRHCQSNAAGIPVYIKPLAQHVLLRPSTTDADVAIDTFQGLYHLPPPEAVPVRRVFDLGANIGLTVAHFAVLYPSARITGVELDEEMASIARVTVRRWQDRVNIVHGGIYHHDGGSVYYELIPGEEHGARIREGGTRRSPSVTLDSLMASDDVVDYVKMDLEGAEDTLLSRQTDWLQKVRTIKVEVREPYTLGRCHEDLQRCGFRTRDDELHWACVIGVRDHV